jgi:tetratricopeptide (TPR) repeat protein
MITTAHRLLAMMAVLLSGMATHAAEPWDIPFAGDPKAMVEAAKSIRVRDAQPVIVLLEQYQYTIDDSGRTTSKLRKVFRIVTGDGVEEWSSIEQEYQPWHENKPEMRARVIGIDGAVHWLETQTIADSPASEYDQSVFSDRRVVRAPLPAVAVGAVIEYEIVLCETAPLLDAGEARRTTIFDGVPIERFQLSIEAGKSVPLKIVTKLIPESAIRRGAAGGRTRFECNLGPLEPRKEVEGDLPSDVPNYPYVAFSTGRSWQEIATRYEGIVDQQIKTGDLKPLVEGIARTQDALTVAMQIAARLHREIRYTGVEFGEAEIVPRTPEETLKRKYGDCKDKASLLVAALRAEGLKAYVALLDAGFGTDVDEELPGLGMFNHAIVYVAGEHPLWIDATSAETRIGNLPTPDQGRLALIASRGTTALARTPESAADDNKQVHTIEIHMSDFGAGEIRETLEASGYMEARMRQLYDGGDEKKVKEALERYVKRDFSAKSVGHFAVTKRDDFNQGFRLQVEANSAKRTITEQDDAVAVLFPSLVLRELPYSLTRGLKGEREEEKVEPRKGDFVFNEPHDIEYHYKIYPPAFFKPKDLSSSVDVKIGTAEYRRNFQTNPDGTVDAVFRFNTGKRRLSAVEFDQFREGLRKYYADSETPEVLRFISEASEYVALGETGKALKLVQETAAKHESELGGQVRLSRMLVTAGAVEKAIAVARQVVQRDPASSQGWQALGWAYQHDSFGRRFQGNWNPEEAEKCYREALKLDADDSVPKVDLAILLETNARGQRYGKGARLNDAVSLYREVLKTTPDSGVEQNLAVTLLYAGRYAEAKEELKKLQGTQLQTALSTVLTAITDSSARAIIDSQARVPDERARVMNLVNSSQVLTELRRYDRALDLMKAAIRLASVHELQARAELLGKMKRYETALYPETDPRYPVQQVFLEVFSAQPDFQLLKPFFTKREDWTALREGFSRRWRNSMAERSRLASSGFGQENILDFVISMLEIKRPDDDAFGYRISGISALGTLPVMYVVKEDGKYRILGTTDSPEKIGEIVLELLVQNKIKAAQWWLDRVVPDLQPDSSDGTGGPAARFLWSGVVEATRGPAAISAAAASLIGPYNGSSKAIQLLKDARMRAAAQIDKGQIDLALCASLERGKNWNELMIVAKRLEATHPFERDGFRFVVKAAGEQEKWRELQSEAERRLKTASEDREALHAMAKSMIHNGDRKGAAPYLKKLTDSPYAGPEEVQFEAWNSLLSGNADNDLLAKLEKFSGAPGLISADYWYTVGMLQAFLGKPEEAQRSLTKALGEDDEGASDAKAWALASKIYGQYGLTEVADTAYEKAATFAPSDEMARWALSLAIPKKTSQNDGVSLSPSKKTQ